MNMKLVAATGLLLSRVAFAAPCVDPNRAGVTELDTLPRIGRARAASILKERAKGPFASLDALAKRVRGVGPKTIVLWQKSGKLCAGVR